MSIAQLIRTLQYTRIEIRTLKISLIRFKGDFYISTKLVDKKMYTTILQKLEENMNILMKCNQFLCCFGKFHIEKKTKNIKLELFHYLLEPKLKQCTKCRKEKVDANEKPLCIISPYRVFFFFKRISPYRVVKMQDLLVYYIDFLKPPQSINISFFLQNIKVN